MMERTALKMVARFSRIGALVGGVAVFLLMASCAPGGTSLNTNPTPALTQVEGVAYPTPVSPILTRNPGSSPTPYLTITFTCAEGTSEVSAKVCVQTLPGTQLTIAVTYCSGEAATNNSLKGIKTANSQGNYEWDWVPQTSCRGNVNIKVTAYLPAVGTGPSWQATAETIFTLK
jgi:hypothetical protein